MKGEYNKVIAVIGDGINDRWLAYEALNNAGRSNRDMIVVLNDNQMSISIMLVDHVIKRYKNGTVLYWS